MKDLNRILKRIFYTGLSFLLLVGAVGGFMAVKYRREARQVGVVTVGTAPDGTRLYRVWDARKGWIYFTSNRVINN